MLPSRRLVRPAADDDFVIYTKNINENNPNKKIENIDPI